MNDLETKEISANESLKNHYVRRLLFYIFMDDLLVERATSWLRKDIAGVVNVPNASIRGKLAQAIDPDTEDVSMVRRVHDALSKQSWLNLAEKVHEIEVDAGTQIDRLTGHLPVAMSATSYGTWSQMSKWSVQEAACLSLGLEPLQGVFEALDAAAQLRTEPPRLVAEFKNRKLVLEKNGGARAIHQRPPRTFVKMLFDLGWRLPDQMCPEKHTGQRKAGSKPDSVEDNLVPPAEDKLEGRERASLLRLVAGMGASKYGLTTGKVPSRMINRIVDDLSLQGIEISEPTAKRWLEESTKYLTKNK